MRAFILASLLVSPVLATDLDFKEQFADPTTRTASLSRLVPDTRDWYFYRALDHQLSGRHEECTKILAEWRQATQRKEFPLLDEGLDTLEKRALLLTYSQNPEQKLEDLRNTLDLTFEDTKPDAFADEKLPDALAAEAISPEAYEKHAATQHRDAPWKAYSQKRLFAEMDKATTFSNEQRLFFIRSLNRKDHPATVALIAALLESSKAGNAQFTLEAALLDQLTLAQLEELRQFQPELTTNLEFVRRYLVALKPVDSIAARLDRKIQADYAQRCVDFTRTLPPAFSRFHLAALAQHLRLQRELGNHPMDDFIAYLAIPRRGHALIREARDGEIPANPGSDDEFAKATGFPGYSGDESLIRGYLDHFLGTMESTAPFAPYFEAKRLAILHAEARLLAGGEPEKWAKALDPVAFRNLQDHTTTTFAPGQPEFLPASAVVKLALDLKNTPDLLVRVYTLDLPTYLANHGEEPSVDLDLDGLVPTSETRLSYQQPPLLRHRETLDLPELSGRGAWIVEAVSKGVAARALIRKGMLIPAIDPAPEGTHVRVFDETGAKVPDASVVIHGKTYQPGEGGRIFIPYLPKVGEKFGTVRGLGIAAPIKIDSTPRDPELRVAFHLDREQLISNEKATLLMRLALDQNGVHLPLSRLRNLTLKLTATLADNITTERVISDDLKPAAQQTIDFLVPPDALSLKLDLSARFDTAQKDERMLNHSQTFPVNPALMTERISSAFFSLTPQGYQLELRGRNGEPIPNRAVVIAFHHEDYVLPISVHLRTNPQGRIGLGSLTGISSVQVNGHGLSPTSFYTDEFKSQITWPNTLTASIRDEIRLPIAEAAEHIDRKLFTLFRLIDGLTGPDHSDHLSVSSTTLVVKPLPAGDYRLTIDGRPIILQITEAAEQDGLYVAPGRLLGKHLPTMPSITSATVADGNLSIQVANASPNTRVSLFGSRYLLPHMGRLVPFNTYPTSYNNPSVPTCDYLTERLLDDEMRYILERRRAQTFPGVMLPRAGMLINRWSQQESEGVLPPLEEGVHGMRESGSGFGSDGVRYSSAGSGKMDLSDQPSPDFLASTSAVRYDATVNADGLLVVPMANFATSQSIRIVVTDGGSSASQVLPLPPSDPPLRDLRLGRPLDASKHHIGTRGSAVLLKDQEARIDNMLDADWRAFNTLRDAWTYLTGAASSDGTEKLTAFEFLSKWPDFDEPSKLRYLSEHASHELHLFLFRKDRAFFDRHVRAQLQEKQDPTFIDDYLLGRDLNGYLRPFAWNRLNAAEKALLAQALPAARERITTQLRQRWELEAPDAESENELFLATLRGEGLDMGDSLAGLGGSGAMGSSYITNKLRSIIIPSLNFEDTTVEEAIQFLRQRSVELDMNELDPARKGVNFVLSRPAGPGTDIASLRIKQLRLRNVPLSVALKYICDNTRMRFKADDYAITLVPQTETGEDLFTRTFRVPRDFKKKLAPDAGGEASATITDLLRSAGVVFPEGAMATLSGQSLIAINTPTELDKIEQLAANYAAAPTAKRSHPTGSVLPELDAFSDPFAESAPAGLAPAPASPPVPSSSDSTKIWQEANYYKHSGTTDEEFIPLNRFWIDLAIWNGQGLFLSPHFNACITNENEALMCLALLDLPFKADKPQVEGNGSTLQVKARSPMLLFYKDTRETDKVAKDSSVLVRQTLHRLGEEHSSNEGRKVENALEGELVAGEPYGLSLVITNPDGNERRIDVLAQIPAGAIPLSGQPVTLAKTVVIEPYGVEKLDLAFYFPAPGTFPLYPLHVAEGDTILAHTAPRQIVVGSSAPAPDGTSWPSLARDGTNEAILAKLRTANLDELDLSLIRWRLHDRSFFEAVDSLLQERLHFDSSIAAYGFLHGNISSMRNFLESTTLRTEFGEWLDSQLLDIRPATHRDFVFLEFDALVNPRSHRVNDQPYLSNSAAAEFYERVLDQLAWKPAHDDVDQLRLAYLLQLQDRTAECIDRFTRIDPGKLNGRLAYDYLHASILFAQEKPAEAAAIAVKYANHPLALWRERFGAVTSQASEIAALAEQKPEAPPSPVDIEPSLEIATAPDGGLLLTHRNLDRVTLRLFNVDLEVLFSKDPFLSGGSSSLPPIRPNETREVALANNAKETRVELPETFRNGNVLVAADTGTDSVLQVLDSRALELLRQSADNTLQVLDTKTGKPLSKSYVKVYAEKADGEVVFLKDGYTDLRGKFDYLSVSSNSALRPKRVAILISHPSAGAKTLTFEP
jgi:hypothetical protein